MPRLALIGCEESTVDILAAASRRDATVFAAVADADLDQARRAARALGCSITAGSLDELLTQHADALDGVLIHGPNSTRAALAEQAAGSGKHVLVDSPWAFSLDVADKAIRAAQHAGVCLMVGQAMRLMPSQQEVKNCLTSGKLGDPGLLRIHSWQPRENDARDCLEPQQASQAILGRIIPLIDLANWLFEALPTTIYAAAQQPDGSSHHVPDYVQLHLGYPQDGMALIGHHATPAAGPDYFSLSMIGSAGAAYADDHHNMHLLYRGGEPAAIRARQEDGHAAQLREFLGAIGQQRPAAITGDDGRAAIQAALAAVESLGAGRAVHLAGGSYELT